MSSSIYDTKNRSWGESNKKCVTTPVNYCITIPIWWLSMKTTCCLSCFGSFNRLDPKCRGNPTYAWARSMSEWQVGKGAGLMFLRTAPAYREEVVHMHISCSSHLGFRHILLEFWKSMYVTCQTWFRVRESRARNYVRILLQRIEPESMPWELAVLSTKAPRKLIFQNISCRINLVCGNGFLNVGQNTKSTRSQLPGFQKTHTSAPPERLGQLWNCETRQISFKKNIYI
jgi:hypothetical protein